jgi:hypothetical protein
MFVRIKSLDRNYDAKAQYAKHSPVPPDHTSIDPGTGVETWVWNMEVTRKRLIENPEPETIVGKTVWELYKAECRYTVAFDAQGNRMDSRFTGAGCFDKDGKLYKRDGESDFAYDFLSI